MYPLVGKEHLQLRKEQGDNGRCIRDGGRMAEEVLKLAREKRQVTACDLYNVATEIYKPGRTDFPALIPQNGAMAELLLSRLPAEVEIQEAVLIS